jgi:protein TonB
MAAKNKPYEQFGTYLLFKKLESDALSELWRAARIEDSQLGPLVAVRKLTGGDRAALVASAETARDVVPQLTGTSFAKQQIIDVINGVPFVAHDYSGGRSLRHIVDRARGGAGITPNPIPIDQAIVIAEKVALSLDTLANIKRENIRLVHGALIPQFVWVSDDGEIRVAGQLLGKGIIASLKDAKVAQEIGRYFPPEYQATGEPQKTSAVYGVGAILYLIVTGSEPPDPMTSSAWTQSVHAAKTMSGAPIPDDIRTILDKSFVLDPGTRYASISEMKQALSALAHGGKYSASTFNLAFYLSSLLKKEMEGEAIEREKESKVNVAAYVEAPPTAAAAVSAPSFDAHLEHPKSKAPLVIAAAVVAAAIGIGAWFMFGSKSKTAPAPKLASAATPAVPQKPKIVSEPIVSSPAGNAGATSTAATASADPAAQKKAFEDAVNQKLQQEMMKLQEDYTRQLQKQQSKNAPVASAAPPAATPTPSAPARTATSAAEEHAPSAAQLDASRHETPARVEPAAPTPTPAPIAQTQPVAAAAPAAPAVHEGDVIEVSSLDTPPHLVHAVKPQYPPIAQRQRIEGTVLLTVLVTENGDVADVRLLRGDNRFGFDDAAIRAARSTKFSPPIKDGKRVKTWYPLPFKFQM